MKSILITILSILTITAFSQSVELNNNPAEVVLSSASGQETLILSGGDNQDNWGFIRFNNGNDQTILIDGNYAQTNQGRVITDQLEIRGGADLAEYFSTSGNKIIEAGQVVTIDPINEGSLAICSEKYDRGVVGIVSGANGVGTGMFMGHQGSIADGALPVALTGRSYVQTTTQNGAIVPGDFLTSSSTPGHAMRVKNMKKARGAIIGKAMTKADEHGFVLVLINLQ